MLGADEDTQQQTVTKAAKKITRSKEQYFEDFLVDMFAGADFDKRVDKLQDQYRSGQKDK